MRRKILLFIPFVLSLILLPISFTLWLLDFRFLRLLYFKNIGHLICEPDCYLKSCVLGKQKRRKVIIAAPTRRTFFSYPKHICCNEDLLDLWKQHFYIIKSPYLTLIYKIMRLIKFLDVETKKYLLDYLGKLEVYSLNYNWDKPPNIFLPKHHIEKGREALKILGIPEGKPYVVFANRDSAYGNDENIYIVRNGDINDYHLALKELVNEGYYCIRIGYHKSQPLNWDLLKGYENKIIDYTRSSLVAGWLDLFLVAQSAMFLSGSSGLRELGMLFKIPTVSINQVPLLHFPLKKIDLSLPKIYVDMTTGYEIPFKTVLSSDAKNFIHNREFEKHNICLRSNTPEEILMAVKEEIKYLREGLPEKTKHQIAFESLIPENSSAYPMASRISDFFLKKYENLL